MISQALRINESTVRRHLADYTLSGKLKSENVAVHKACNLLSKPQS